MLGADIIIIIIITMIIITYWVWRSYWLNQRPHEKKKLQQTIDTNKKLNFFRTVELLNIADLLLHHITQYITVRITLLHESSPLPFVIKF